jgi:hypothetical protein
MFSDNFPLSSSPNVKQYLGNMCTFASLVFCSENYSMNRSIELVILNDFNYVYMHRSVILTIFHRLNQSIELHLFLCYL